METYELRYFLGVAEPQNIRHAAEKLKVSPASLSKAVSRLESELGVKLFAREGRQIRLTDSGRALQLRAGQIVRLEEAARAELSGLPGSIHAVVAGPEALLPHFGTQLENALGRQRVEASFELRGASDDEALRLVDRGDASLAIVALGAAGAPGSAKAGKLGRGYHALRLGQASFLTCVGPGHPLYSRARRREAVEVNELLERYPFASPSLPVLGRVGARQSADGWRDDRFPRRVKYSVSSLGLLVELVGAGRAAAYLPDYLVEKYGFERLIVKGCPYGCEQEIWLVAKRSEDEPGWISRLF
jgi:DNA-binding transcriptional LysR family regulator